MQDLSDFFGIIILGFFISLGMAVWVYKDGVSRGDKELGWMFAGFTLFLGFFALPFWLIFRPSRRHSDFKAEPRLCPHCGKYFENNISVIFCPLCGKNLFEVKPKETTNIIETSIVEETPKVNPIKTCNLCGMEIPLGYDDCFFCEGKK